MDFKKKFNNAHRVPDMNLPKEVLDHHVHAHKTVRHSRHKKHVAHFNIFLQMMVKHFRLILKSKLSLFTILFGPILIILFIGIAFNNSQLNGISISVYSDTDGFDLNESNSYFNTSYDNLDKMKFSSVSRSVLEEFEDKYIVKLANSLDLCQDNVKNGITHMCVFIPNDLNPEDVASKHIEIYIDQSEINLAYNVLDEISYLISTNNNEIRVKYINDLLNNIDDTLFMVNRLNRDIDFLKEDISSIDGKILSIETKLKSSSVDFDVESIPFQSLSDLNFNVRGVLEDLSKDASSIDKLLKALNDDYVKADSDYNKDKSDYDDCIDSAESTSCDDDHDEMVESRKKRSQIYDYYKYVGNESLGFDNISSALSDVSSISSLIRNVELKINTVKQKVSKSDTAVKSALSETSSVVSGVKRTASSINDLKSKLDKIKSDIGSLSLTDVNKISNPIKTDILSVVKEDKHVIYSFPSLFLVFILFVSILLSSIFVMQEKVSSAHFRNTIAPVISSLFVFTEFLMLFVIVLFEVLVVSLISFFVFEINLFLNFGYFSLLIILSSSIFILIGMIIGNLSDNEDSTTLLSIFVSAILLLLSSVILPIENMSLSIQRFAKFNPLVLLSELGKKIILFDSSFDAMKFDLMYSGIYLISLVLILVLIKIIKRKL